jgi:hypothetical protein
MSPAPGFYVMGSLAACPSADTLAGLFKPEARPLVKAAFAEAVAFSSAAELVALQPGVLPLGRDDLAAQLLAVLRCGADRHAELWLVYLACRFDTLDDAERCARGMAMACRSGSAFAVFELQRLHELAVH